MTKLIRVFAFPAHGTKDRVSGVDWARIIQPMQQLNGFEHKGYKFETYIFDPIRDEKLEWNKVADSFDLVYFNYTALPWAFAAMGTWVRKFGKKMVMDLDDSLWDLSSDNPAYKAYHKGSQGIHDFNCICAEVDGMTTTNSYLKNVIVHNTLKRHEQVKVFPNYIDLNLYNHRPPFKDNHEIELVHFGSTTHFLDLENKEFEQGIDMIFKEYPHVYLNTVGAVMPKYRMKWGQRYRTGFGHQDVLHWIQDKDKFPAYMSGCDIMVVPLMNNVYTRCKSSIKYLEASSASKPGCYQKIRQYEEIISNGKNGFVCESAEDWYRSIKALVEDAKLRREMGEAAFKTVQDGWQIQDHIKDYAEHFLEVLT